MLIVIKMCDLWTRATFLDLTFNSSLSSFLLSGKWILNLDCFVTWDSLQLSTKMLLSFIRTMIWFGVKGLALCMNCDKAHFALMYTFTLMYTLHSGVHFTHWCILLHCCILYTVMYTFTLIYSLHTDAHFTHWCALYTLMLTLHTDVLTKTKR